MVWLENTRNNCVSWLMLMASLYLGPRSWQALLKKHPQGFFVHATLNQRLQIGHLKKNPVVRERYKLRVLMRPKTGSGEAFQVDLTFDIVKSTMDYQTKAMQHKKRMQNSRELWEKLKTGWL